MRWFEGTEKLGETSFYWLHFYLHLWFWLVLKDFRVHVMKMENMNDEARKTSTSSLTKANKVTNFHGLRFTEDNIFSLSLNKFICNTCLVLASE